MKSKYHHIILSNYCKFWGTDYEIIDSQSTELAIKILEFKPASDEEDWVYVTFAQSLSKPTYEKASSSYLTEFFIQSDKKISGLANSLFSLCYILQKQKLNIQIGQTLSNDKPIVDGSKMTDALLLKPSIMFDNEMDVIKVDDFHIHLMWLIPIYRNEKLFFQEHGLYALINEFSKGDVNTSNFGRLSLSISAA